MRVALLMVLKQKVSCSMLPLCTAARKSYGKCLKSLECASRQTGQQIEHRASNVSHLQVRSTVPGHPGVGGLQPTYLGLQDWVSCLLNVKQRLLKGSANAVNNCLHWVLVFSCSNHCLSHPLTSLSILAGCGAHSAAYTSEEASIDDMLARLNLVRMLV